MQQILADVGEWCKYRNEVIHCLLNKNISSVDEKLAEQAEHGFRLARDLDTQVRALQKGNVIRRRMNLKIEKTVKVPKEEKTP